MPLTMEIAEVPSLPVKCIAYPQGKFTTGCADIMIGKGREGTLLRLHYPTELGDIRDIEIDNWTSMYLGEKYSEGIARNYFPYFPPICEAFVNATLDVLVPAVWEAKIANSNFPLVIYSHGLSANRSCNNSVCNDLASYGFIVASLEHRDGSACSTVTFTPDLEEEWTFQDLVPNNENEFDLRAKQVKKRSEECSRALDTLTKLNSGDPLANEFEESDFDLQTLKGKIDLSNPIIMGHSFGGATTILTLDMDKRFKLGVALDPWMFPLKDSVEQLQKSITQPLLIIAVSHWQTERNLKCLKGLEKENVETFSLRFGTHFHQTDIATICNHYAYIFQKLLQCYEPTYSPALLLTINHALIKKFLFKKLDIHREVADACKLFLENHEDKFSNYLVSEAKTMLGWDYVTKSFFEMLFL